MTNNYKTLIHILIIFFASALIFLPRLDSLPYRGEEPRRVVSSYELLQSGNWFVPTIQQEVFLSRPPLQNWVIAATGMIRGNFDHLTGRLPSVLCVLLTALLIYYYSLSSLSRGTALLASLFFLTMPQVIQLGRTAETELMFTLFLSGSFLLWHRGEMKNWPNTLKWTVAYFLLACATLTKGINQAPVYFAAIIGINLLINRRLHTLLSAGHLLGLSLFCLIVGFWQWGFVHYVGAKTGWLMHMGDVAMRFNDNGIKKYITHGITFPFELFAVMLPWSILLPVCLKPSFWQQRMPAQAKPVAIFCLGAIAITILSVWIPPGAQTRYYMPLFPCFAILAAIVAETVCRPAESKSRWQLPDLFIKVLLILIPLAGLLNMTWSAFDIHWIVPPEPLANALIYLTGTLILSAFLVIILRKKSPEKLYLSVMCYTLFAALTISLVYTDTRKIIYNDAEPKVVAGLKMLPANTNLVSIGPIAFDFLYYYMLHTGKTIPIIPYDTFISDQNAWNYVCTDAKIKLPQHWQTLMEMEVGRYKKEYTKRQIEKVIIAKRISPETSN